MSKARSSIFIAARSAFVFGVTTLFLMAMNRALDGHRKIDWLELLKHVGTFSAGFFAVVLVFTYIKLRAGAPAEEILDADTPPIDPSVPALSGFVAMEYYALILNRTFVVFIAPEGLLGWKAEGIVTAGNPLYFKPYAKMLEDPDLMRDREAIRRLSQLPGGFFIPRSDIVAAEVIDKQKFGMAGIPHSGRIKLRLSSGKSREFILLGNVYVDSIRRQILG